MKRPLLLALHRYLGLVTGVFFLVTAVTGGLMLYKHQILYAYYPELAAARAEAESVLDAHREDLLALLWAQQEKAPLLRVRYPEEDWPFYSATYASGELAYFSPTGEKIVSSRGYDNPITIIFDIHHEWLAGEVGELASGVIHIGVLVLLALGVYAWWPRNWRKSLHLVVRGSAVKMSYSWHRVLGAISSAVLIVAVGTGVMMVFYSSVQTVLVSVFGGEVISISSAVEPGEKVLPWASLSGTINRVLPEGRVRLISFPTESDQALVVRKRMPGEWHQNGRSFIYINPYTAAAYAVKNDMDSALGNQLTHKVYPLHSAGVGGTPYVVLLAIAGFSPLILVPTGFYIWWWKRRKRLAGMPVK